MERENEKDWHEEKDFTAKVSLNQIFTKSHHNDMSDYEVKMFLKMSTRESQMRKFVFTGSGVCLCCKRSWVTFWELLYCFWSFWNFWESLLWQCALCDCVCVCVCHLVSPAVSRCLVSAFQKILHRNTVSLNFQHFAKKETGAITHLWHMFPTWSHMKNINI